MTRAIWLASYPKSGNTWLRILIGCLALKDGETFDINAVPERGGIATARAAFDYHSLIESGMLTHAEIDCLRPRIYEELARRADDNDDGNQRAVLPVRFVKVHDAYTLTPEGEPLLAGRRGADGAIVIVRDPRDVVPSLANHNRKSVDNALEQLNNANMQYCAQPGAQHAQLRHTLLDWSGHVASWLDQTDIPVHLVRYEDLMADTAATLLRALAFAGSDATQEQIERAVRLTDFAQLQAQEGERGFAELPRPHLGGRFFRKGQAGAWRDELTGEQIATIESAHGTMMRRLGYELTGAREGEAA